VWIRVGWYRLKERGAARRRLLCLCRNRAYIPRRPLKDMACASTYISNELEGAYKRTFDTNRLARKGYKRGRRSVCNRLLYRTTLLAFLLLTGPTKPLYSYSFLLPECFTLRISAG
jgi:hypothetical protein